MGRSLASFVAALAAAACMGRGAGPEAPFEPGPVGRVRVLVANPGRSALALTWLDGAGRPARSFPAGPPAVELDLPPGLYCLEQESTGLRVPIPALVEVLDGAPVEIELPGAAPGPAPEGHVWIPGGPALIGDVIGVGAEDERPARIVHVDAFWMAAREVTNQEYAAFLTAQVSVDRRWIDLGSRKCRITPVGDRSEGYRTDAPSLPVVMVSHHGAAAYCRWLTETTGAVHRLPTETEWEKAARGPESCTYAYGNVYTRALANQESGVLRPVASFAPNGFGLFDMTGNVFEWMGNEYDPAASGEPMNQALRGGSYVLDGMYLRNSFRMRQSRSVMTDDIGFRTVVEG